MIDILMAVYNGGKYIEQQINSILQQTFMDWRLLIHDDGSNDETIEIVKRYKNAHPEKIRFLDDDIHTGGAKYNFIYMLQYVEAEYIMFADQDDVWEKDKVQRAYRKIKKAEHQYSADIPILLHGDLKVTDSNLNIISSSMFAMQKLDTRKTSLNDFLVQNNVTGCTMIFNQALKKMCHTIPDDAIMHDWWMALVASAFGKVIYMGDAGILYRQHENNTEGAKNLTDMKYILRKVFNKAVIRKNLELTYKQAENFLNLYDKELNLSQKQLVSAYISMSNMKKFQKYKIIQKYRFMKTGLVRKIAYMIYL